MEKQPTDHNDHTDTSADTRPPQKDSGERAPLGDYTSRYSDDEIKNGYTKSLLCYLGPLVLFPLFMEKANPYVRFHVRQGVNLLLCEVVYGVLYILLNLIKVSRIYWGSVNMVVPSFVPFLLSFFALILMVFVFLGLVNVIKGKAKELPFIGRLKLIKK